MTKNTLLDPDTILKETIGINMFRTEGVEDFYNRLKIESRYAQWMQRTWFERIRDQVLRRKAPPKPEPLGNWRIIMPERFTRDKGDN